MTSLFHDESTFRLSSELSGANPKKLPYAKNQLSLTCSLFNQFVTDIQGVSKVFSGFIINQNIPFTSVLAFKLALF